MSTAQPAEARLAELLAAAQRSGLERLDAELLAAHALGITRSAVIARPERVLDAQRSLFQFQDSAAQSRGFVSTNLVSLYKALGGFATNGVNMTKLESYMLGGRFAQAQFWADVEGHRDDPPLRRAFEELGFFTKHFRILGSYPANPFRQDPSQRQPAE